MILDTFRGVSLSRTFGVPTDVIRVTDHKHRSLGERSDIQVSVRSGHDIGNNSEVFAGHQALATILVELVLIVRNLVPSLSLAEGKMFPALIERELEQVPTFEE